MVVDDRAVREYESVGVFDKGFMEYLEEQRSALMISNGTPGFRLSRGEIYGLFEGVNWNEQEGDLDLEMEPLVRREYDRLQWHHGNKVGVGIDGFVSDGVVHMIFSKLKILNYYGS